MKLAIMQPYFFPYIGYWQLIHAADRFVLFDDVQYKRHGWINRNRILKPGGGWQYILVPLKKHSVTELIKNVKAHPDRQWKELIVVQLAHYKKKARYFDETIELVNASLYGNDEQDIAAINFSIIKHVCASLNIKTEIIRSSEQGFDYANVSDAGEWALRISEQMGAAEYINPAAGAELFDPEKFSASNIELSFLKSQEMVYPQRGDFEPSLSIIDVLMFNGIEGTKSLMKNHSIGSGDIRKTQDRYEMSAMFPIERDDEFYVFLKSRLPSGYRIEAEPSASYYSEWMFCYNLYDRDRLIQTFEGDYRTLAKGALVREAKELLRNLEREDKQC
jgi:hypothetical protein